MNKNKLALTFNRAQEAVADKYQKNLSPLLQELSSALQDFQDIGVDVSLSFNFGAYQAFYMFGIDSKSLSAPLSGVLTIEGSQHLLTILVKHNGEDCLKMALSKDDFRFEGSSGTQNGKNIFPNLRAQIIDFNDAEAMKAFQIFVLEVAAHMQYAAAQDVAHSFRGKQPGFHFGPKDFK